MAELTVSQLNKILSTTEENIQKKYDNLASLYTAQSTQLEVELSKLKTGLKSVTNTRTKSVKKETKDLLNPLDTIANHLKVIKTILEKQFKKTSLGSADTDKGIIKRNNTPLQRPTNMNNVENENSSSNGLFGLLGSLITNPYVLGTIIGAKIVDEIRKQLGETWTGMAQLIVKPLAIYGSILSGGTKGMLAFGRLLRVFERLPFIGKYIRAISTGMSKLPKILANARAAIQLYITEPLGRWGTTVGKNLAQTFPKIAKTFKLLSRAAVPLTLLLETLDMFKLVFGGDKGFLHNVQETSDEISRKGILGRALHGFTHSLTTITTAVTVTGQAIGAWWDVLKITFDDIVESFRGLVHDMKMTFFSMWNSLAKSTVGTFLNLEGYNVKEENKKYQMERMERAIKRGQTDEVGKAKALKLRQDAYAKNLEPMAGESLTEFLSRISKADKIKNTIDRPIIPKLNEDEKYFKGLEMLKEFNNDTPRQQNNTSVNILNQFLPPRTSKTMYDLDASLFSPQQ